MKKTIALVTVSMMLLTSCQKKITPAEQVNNAMPEKTTQAMQARVAILLQNPGFETGGPSQTPTGWTTWASTGNANADYTQAGGKTGAYSLAHYKAQAYQVHTSQTITGLANGYYSLTAWVQNGGGQKVCFLTAKNFGGPEKMTSLPVSSSWVQVIIRGIQVSNGSCTIGLWSDANAGNWCKLDDMQFVKDDKPYTFLKGGDISELSYIESKGGKFYENGVQKDAMQIFKNNGFNIIRLRLYNDPGNPNFTPSSRLPAGFQNPTDILALSRRAKAMGFQIQLTLHYSDYWTNGSSQTKPHDWVNLNYTQLKQAVYDFTFNFMNKMKAQGTTPEFVSLGNESGGGILFPEGSKSNFAQLAELYNKGYDAVKAVSPTSQVIIHLDDGGNSSQYDWYFGRCATYGVRYDIIGASYYPYWTKKTVAQVKDWANYTANKFNKDIIIMETGYNWNPTKPDGFTGQLKDNGPYTNIYPSTPEGQRDFLFECFNGLKMVDNGRVIGDLYWDPVMIAVPGVGWEVGGDNVVSNTTLFDFTGKSLVSLNAYKFNN